LSDTKSKDAEDILSEFHDSRLGSKSEPQLSESKSEPQLSESKSEPQLSESKSEPQLSDLEIDRDTSTMPIYDSEERNVIFIGTKSIMTYVSATLTQLSTRHTVTITARGKRITQAVDVSQMIVKRMNAVGYVISDVRISSDSLKSQDGKLRNVSVMEIDITKN
jgi:DNA-binding protein